MRALRFFVRVVLFVVAFSALTVGLVWAFGGEQWTRVATLSEVKEQGYVHLEDLQTYLVFDEGEVHAVLDHYRMPIGREGSVVYCEEKRPF